MKSIRNLIKYIGKRQVKPRVVGLTYDLKKEYVFKKDDPPDANAELDPDYIIQIVTQALERPGHKVIRIGNAEKLLKFLKEGHKVDIVFNLAEGIYGRNRESQIPIILEMCRIPFIGSDGLTLGLTLDKINTKKILSFEGIPTPKFIGINDIASMDGRCLNFPLIVKPRYEGSSKGLDEKAVVTNISKLKKRADWLIATYKQPALVEEFISGQEFTVAVVGNKNPVVLPPVQVRIEGKLNLGNMFYSHSRINSTSLDYVCPAKISKKLEEKIKVYALRTYQTVECRDFGRIDFRVDKKGNPYVLEINPLPSLSTEDTFAIVGTYLGIGYERMVNWILEEGLIRNGLIN